MLLRCESLEPPMSQLGQTRPSPFYAPTSASANCGHRAALAVGSYVPKAAVSRCSNGCASGVDYSITSSAVDSSVGGTVRPSMRAVWWLMTNSNLLDWITGKSAGFAPLRIRPA
jgi:hypothetical protein